MPCVKGHRNEVYILSGILSGPRVENSLGHPLHLLTAR